MKTKILAGFALAAALIFGCSSGDDGSDTKNHAVSSSAVQNSSSSLDEPGSSSSSIPFSPGTYIISGSGEKFSAVKNGLTIGMANQKIQTVIDAIYENSQGNDVIIQFGDGESVLDIGTGDIYFDYSEDELWGTITLTGKITSKAEYMIYLNGVSIVSTADVSNTNGQVRCFAFFNGGSGKLTIESGTISAVGDVTIVNFANGEVNINGGTVKSTTKRTLVNYAAGKITISGGSISTNDPVGDAVTVHNYDVGDIVISGGEVQATGRTAVANLEGTLTISGGRISAGADNSSGTVYNETGTLTISGDAYVLASGKNSEAVRNLGVLNMSSGTAEATGEDATALYNRGTATITGGTFRITEDGSYAIDSSFEEGVEIHVSIPPTIITGGTRGVSN